MSIKKNNIYLFFSALIAGVSGILFGYDTGVISGALIFLRQDFHLTSSSEGLLVSILLVGATVGALMSGYISDKLGRKRILQIAGIIFLIGTICIASANSITMLYICRFMLGISIGISSSAAPSYIAEIAPAEFRGRLVSLFQIFIVLGLFLTFTVNYYVSESSHAWRTMFWLGGIPSIIFFLGLFFLPESPRWLILNSRVNEATKVLNKLRGDNYQNELQDIQNLIHQEQQGGKNWSRLFSKTNIPILVIALGINIISALSGINAINYYAPTIFINAGFGVNAALASTIWIGAVNLIATIIGILFLDKLGRRPLMILGATLMTISVAIIAYALNKPVVPGSLIGYVGIGGVLLFIAAFAISNALLGWLIIGEVFPLNVRGEGAALGAGVNWIGNIVVALVFPVALKQFGMGIIFGVFTFVCFSALIFYIKYLPETKGISLETIETNLLRGAKARYLGQSK
jgi:sugar porter (SP) family MFS transporter